MFKVRREIFLPFGTFGGNRYFSQSRFRRNFLRKRRVA